MQGHMVRSRLQWVSEGERPSRYFCALENSNYTDKTVKSLVRQDQNLFKSNDSALKDCNLKNLLKYVHVKVLSDNQAKLMEGYLTTTELSIALKNTKNNKTPGVDGFPSEFFKFFGRI